MIGAGPEDFVLDTSAGEDRLIVSCDERRDKDRIVEGDVWTYDFKSGKTTILTRINDLSQSFNPHGIHLLLEDNTKWLFVVNHYDRYKKSEIVRYQLVGDTLLYDTSFKYSSSINEVCAIEKNRFYFTNDKLFTGKIMEYANGQFYKLDKGVNYPNGVNVKDGYLYYSTSLSGKLRKAKIIAVGEIEKPKTIAKIKGADNIRFYDNQLITTSHPKFIKFLKHVKNKKRLSPCDVYSLQLENNLKTTVYSSTGDPISAVSTAIIYKDYLYLAQVFEPFLLRVER